MARIVVSGTMVREPRGGSILWYLAWLAGFKMNGHEVYFVEKSEWPNDCYDIPNRIMTSDCSYGYGVVRRLLEKYDLHNSFCFVDYYGTYHGLSKSTVHELFRTADLYVDLEWAQWKEESTHCKMRVFVDGEPGWFQVRIKKWIESATTLPAYDHFFTDGNLIGTEYCDVPTCGIDWKHAALNRKKAFRGDCSRQSLRCLSQTSSMKYLLTTICKTLSKKLKTFTALLYSTTQAFFSRESLAASSELLSGLRKISSQASDSSQSIIVFNLQRLAAHSS